MTVIAVKEVVLPSGAFATVRRLSGLDLLATWAQIGRDPEANHTFVLITMACTIDDKPVEYADILKMDYLDVLKLCNLIYEHVMGPIT